MNQLFYHLIYQEKTKRWLIILDQFEEKQIMTAKELATKIGCTPRTIQTDIQQIKSYFDTSIVLLGEKNGYHFSFQVPLIYNKKKQDLVNQEPLFFFADQLLSGIRRTNQEWARILNLSPASFGRIKQHFVQILEEQYHLILLEKENQLRGKEPAIRQFMYDLYFTMPLYPKCLEQRIESWDFFNESNESESWLLDPVRLVQWGQLAHWRINQGQCLQTMEGKKDIKEQLGKILDETIKFSIPPQEKAALFLLSLNEEQFLNPLHQKKFIKQFSLDTNHDYLVNDFEDVIVYFFETLVILINQFFQVFLSETKEDLIEEGQTDKEVFFNQLMKNYYETKMRFERSVVLTFQLTGSSALQRWIKKKVRHQLQTKGYYVVEDIQAACYNRQLIVVNRRVRQENPSVVCLPTVPEEIEIEQALKVIDW